MASTDMRGFRYTLEPVRKRREWKLDAAMTRVAAVRKQLDECLAMWQRAEDEAVAQAGLAAQAWRDRGDPATQTRLLAFLTQLQRDKTRIESDIDRLRVELSTAQREALRRQQHVETLQRHRTEVLSAYRSDQDRKSNAEADQDWTARTALIIGGPQ